MAGSQVLGSQKLRQHPDSRAFNENNVPRQLSNPCHVRSRPDVKGILVLNPGGGAGSGGRRFDLLGAALACSRRQHDRQQPDGRAWPVHAALCQTDGLSQLSLPAVATILLVVDTKASSLFTSFSV